MEAEGAQPDAAEHDSLLPPHKRLLAGLKRQNCDCSLLLSFVSEELGAHLQGLLNSSTLSPEEIVEASKAAASAAAKAAGAARAIATEKAIAAAKAKAFAKSVLELVAVSVGKDDNSKKNRHPRRKKIKKKHVPVELLYKSRCSVLSSETDEELARRLHRAMNSSPRISTRLGKKSEALGARGKVDGGTIGNGNPSSPVDDYVEPSNGNPVEKSGGRVAMFSRVEGPEKVVEASESFESHQSVGKGVVHARRGRTKQKKLPLSQCCMRAQESSREVPRLEDHPLTGEPKCDTAEDAPTPTKRSSKEEQVPLEARSVWKSKKFKVSQCHSEGKNLHSLCSIPAVTTTSALVKVD